VAGRKAKEPEGYSWYARPRVPLNTDQPPDLMAALDEWCRKNRVTKRQAVEVALRRLLVEGAQG
jgi:hypothetical protein